MSIAGILGEIWGELYWNTSDWLPWIAIQAVIPAALAVVLQWWFNIRWPTVFFTTFAIFLILNFLRLPPSAISPSDLAKMNEGLPRDIDGITLESVSFNHRVLEYRAFSKDALEPSDLKAALDTTEMIAEPCRLFGKWLATRQIKSVTYAYTWPDGGYNHSVDFRDCDRIANVTTSQ